MMIAIGRITKSVGVKGEVNIEALTDDANRFLDVESVFVGTAEDTARKYSLKVVRKSRSGVVAKLGGMDTREQSEVAKGNFVFLQSDQARRPSPGSYFLHELAGLKVVTEDGTEVGVVKEVLRLPGGDTWVVNSGTREIMIPGVKEFIRSVDLRDRKVIIHPIDGLLD
jgi:16S rRNA processing protein RimM